MKQDRPTSRQGEMKENEGKTNIDQSSRRQERVKEKSKWESVIRTKHNNAHEKSRIYKKLMDLVISIIRGFE